MAILTMSDRLTAVELIKRGGVNPDQRRIIEVLSTVNEMLYDAAIDEANDGTIDTHTVRTKNPSGTHVVYNQGVQPNASQTKVIHDVTCNLEAYSEIDCRLVDDAANPDEFISGECVSFIEGMGQDQCEDFVYGNHTLDATNMDGFATRRDAIDGNLCIDAGGTGANLTSIYLVKWGKLLTKYIYPKGAKGLGVSRENRGIQDVDVYDAAGNRTGKMRAVVNFFRARYGLSVVNEKSLIRIANVPLNITGSNLAKLLIKAEANLAIGDGTVSLLCNKQVKTILDIEAMDKNNVVHYAEDPFGRKINMFQDMRIRLCDSILTTESQVV